ncbi:MAG TPA: head decoration protein [Bryobacteraceae bacterium]|nr:head decoration protein [Bryobacteraceae bacterium]
MPVQAEGKYLGDWLKFEAENQYSRDVVTILAGSGAARELLTGMVLGRVTKGAAASAAVAGNTGDGAITAAPAVGAGAKPGVYRVVCIEPAVDGGKFAVEDPNGILIGVATVGIEFTNHLTFTIADGAADFVAGDTFTITVAAGSGKVKQIDFAATDGSDVASGLLLLDTTAPDGADRSGVAIVRNAIVSDNGITWPAGTTANQKSAAIAQLKTAGILVRQGA